MNVTAFAEKGHFMENENVTVDTANTSAAPTPDRPGQSPGAGEENRENDLYRPNPFQRNQHRNQGGPNQAYAQK